MKKKNTALLVSIIILNFGMFCQAEEESAPLGVSFDLTYTSKWLSKGVEAYGSKGGLFKTIDVDFWKTGWGIKVTHRNATSSGYVDNQRFDFRPYYYGTLFDDEKYFTKYNLSVGYEYYPGLARHKANTTYEWIFSFSWPKLLPCGLVPGYIAHYEYPASGGDVNRKVAGWVHRFLLGYDLKIEELPNPLHLSGEVAYYDGLGNKCHDWAYYTFGLSSKFDITENLSFVPRVYLQRTMDRSISKHKDIAYTMLSMKYVF